MYDPAKPAGARLIRSATSLHGIDDGSYDVVLASHTLEHVANPLLALSEWRRVVGPDGHLVLVVPHLENTFDHRRPVTTLAHLDEDFARSVGEDDDTHVAEFIELCDLGRVPDNLTSDEFRVRTIDFVENRSLHHHVFDTELVVRLLDHAGYGLLAVETALPFHVVVLARAGGGDNDAVLAGGTDWRRASVFQRDRATYRPSVRS